MTQQNSKRIGQPIVQKRVTRMDTLRDTWTVMKPFVHFSIKALRVLAQSLIFIVKHIPKPDDEKSRRAKNDKIIKI